MKQKFGIKGVDEGKVIFGKKKMLMSKLTFQCLALLQPTHC